MWLINGPFDCAQVGDEKTLKTKLLKTSGVYGLGRHQDSDLCINSKKISRQHGEFIVGEHSKDDVSNGALVPTLSLRNNKTTALKISRGESALLVNPDSTLELEPGDIVRLTGSISATVTWAPVVCFHAHEDAFSTVDTAACASMGIKLVTKHSRDVTHHLTSSLTAPLVPSMLYSLLAPACFVTPEWLVDFIRSDNDHGLEKTYNPPIESGFLPEIDSAFVECYPMVAKKSVWAPNDVRKNLFEDIRFVFVLLGSGAGTQSKGMADVVTRGGAVRQFVNVEKEAEEYAKGVSGAWSAVLKKRKVTVKEGMRSGLVLVGEEELMVARGIPKETRNAWEAMVDEAQSVNMRIVHPSLIAEAIFKADVSVLDCVFEEDAANLQGVSTSNHLPVHVPPMHPEESSLPMPHPTKSREASVEPSQMSGPGPSRRLTRRAASQTPVPEPVPLTVPMETAEETTALPLPRKPLKRRAKAANNGGIVNEILGIDESTVVYESPAESQPQPQGALAIHPQPDVVPVTPMRPGRLKRRAGTVAAISQPFPDLSILQEEEEPPLKKFKALFEQSGQGSTEQCESYSLPALLEEEESSQNQTQTQTRGRKRKAGGSGGEAEAAIEIEDLEEPTAPKRRAVEGVNILRQSQQHKPPLLRKPTSGAKSVIIETKQNAEKARGAAPGKPDTDPSFLRAIASTKRGKKTEDDFDREFNRLRIARPDINNTKDAPDGNNVRWGKEWEGLDDFEKDVGLRGNFMQIVEMDVWRDNRPPGQIRHNIRREDGLSARMDWDGREDFKKFKRKMNTQPRVPVQLVVSESKGHAAGQPYPNSKGDRRLHGLEDMSQSQGNDLSQPAFTQTQSKYRTKPHPKQGPQGAAKAEMSTDQDDDEVEEAIGNIKSKKTERMSKGQKKVQALFTPGSDDEDVYVEAGGNAGDDVEDFDLTLQSSRSQKDNARRTNRKMAVPEESDSEDGMNFGRFTTRVKKLKQ